MIKATWQLINLHKKVPQKLSKHTHTINSPISAKKKKEQTITTQVQDDNLLQI